FQGLAADRVEDDVEVTGGVLEAGRPVVDHLVGPQPAHELQVVPRGRSNDLGSAPAGELHGEQADAPGRALDQDALPGRQVRPVQVGAHWNSVGVTAVAWTWMRTSPSPGSGPGSLLVGERLRASSGVQADCFHGLLLSRRSS